MGCNHGQSSIPQIHHPPATEPRAVLVLRTSQWARDSMRAQYCMRVVGAVYMVDVLVCVMHVVCSTHMNICYGALVYVVV